MKLYRELFEDISDLNSRILKLMVAQRELTDEYIRNKKNYDPEYNDVIYELDAVVSDLIEIHNRKG